MYWNKSFAYLKWKNYESWLFIQTQGIILLAAKPENYCEIYKEPHLNGRSRWNGSGSFTCSVCSSSMSMLMNSVQITWLHKTKMNFNFSLNIFQFFIFVFLINLMKIENFNLRRFNYLGPSNHKFKTESCVYRPSGSTY